MVSDIAAQRQRSGKQRAHADPQRGPRGDFRYAVTLLVFPFLDSAWTWAIRDIYFHAAANLEWEVVVTVLLFALFWSIFSLRNCLVRLTLTVADMSSWLCTPLISIKSALKSRCKRKHALKVRETRFDE